MAAKEATGLTQTELMEATLAEKIVAEAQASLGMALNETNLWTAEYDNGIGMVVVFVENGDGTAQQWMVFSEGSSGELLPVGATDKLVYLKMVQVTSENADGSKLIRIGLDEKVTKDPDMILPPFMIFTLDADGKVVGNVEVLNPFGADGQAGSVKVLAKEIERFVPKTEVQQIVEKVGLPEGKYEMVEIDGNKHLTNEKGELVAAYVRIEKRWVNMTLIKDDFESYTAEYLGRQVEKYKKDMERGDGFFAFTLNNPIVDQSNYYDLGGGSRLYPLGLLQYYYYDNGVLRTVSVAYNSIIDVSGKISTISSGSDQPKESNLSIVDLQNLYLNSVWGKSDATHRILVGEVGVLLNPCGRSLSLANPLMTKAYNLMRGYNDVQSLPFLLNLAPIWDLNMGRIEIE